MPDGAMLQVACGEYTDDAFLGGKLRIFQSKRGYRAGVDSVILAAAVPARSGDHVLELGSGAGVAALCLGARVQGVRITGVESEEVMASLAEENACRNGMSDRVGTVIGDILSFPRFEIGVPDNSCDHAFANPPFYLEGRICEPEDPMKRRAYLRREGDLEFWVGLMIGKLKTGGSLTVILPSGSLDEILSALRGRAGHTVIFPLFTQPGSPARRVVVQAIKGRKGEVRLMRGLVLHGADRGFSAEARSILWQGAALALSSDCV